MKLKFIGRDAKSIHQMKVSEDLTNARNRLYERRMEEEVIKHSINMLTERIARLEKEAQA